VTIDLPVFTGDLNGLSFTSSQREVVTPIYKYNVDPLGDGVYRLYRKLTGGGNADPSSYNQQVFRGQVATMSTYYNQLAINNTVLDHVYLDSNVFLGNSINPNQYAISDSIFAPYQYHSEEGSLWYKNHVTIERLFMTKGLNVDNRAYGSIIGADFPVMKLGKGWKFLPTAFITYNGGHQTFNNVSMYQNGGQGGFMGTFAKKDFMASILAYGGGYFNEMSVQGNTDKTGNWFAGTAVKGAYNYRISRNLILQPNALVSYNIFGKQNWGSDFGGISMNSGYLNGINIAPGLNIIYGREGWSTYMTAQYVYNINDNLNGRAGGVNLPSISMRHGYFEFGYGFMKTFKERLMTYAQVTFREGGRRGVGFQLGLNWKFDGFIPVKKPENLL